MYLTHLHMSGVPLSLIERSSMSRTMLSQLSLLCVTLLGASLTVVSAHALGKEGKFLADNSNDPLAQITSFAQVVFVSCNRHNANQSYWAVMASVVQCEVADDRTRNTAPECVAMYRGNDPPILSSAQRRSSTSSSSNSINKNNDSDLEMHTLGACQAMDMQQEKSYARDGVSYHSDAGSVARADMMMPRPVDAFVWLGDAIYSDKPEKGSKNLPRGHLRFPLDVVQKMWQTQRACESYTAFRTTCLRPRSALTSELCLDADNGTNGANNLNNDKGDNESILDNTEDACTERARHSVKEDEDEFAVVGTWDDHDMGMNDGGAEYPYKNFTQKYLMHFLNASRYDVRWRRPGVYTMHTISFRQLANSTHVRKPNRAGIPNSSDAINVEDENDESLATSAVMMRALSMAYEHAVCLILLDARYFRDPPNASRSGDMLGEAQWRWLEQRLQEDISDNGVLDRVDIAQADDDETSESDREHAHDSQNASWSEVTSSTDRHAYNSNSNSNSSSSRGVEEGLVRDAGTTKTRPRRTRIRRARCALTLIGNGIQFMLDEKPTENWAAFPRSRDRLLSLLRRHRIDRAVFLTGDVHMGEIGLDSTAHTVHHILGYPMIEATSSGLTHAEGEAWGATTLVPWLLPSPRRVGLFMQRNFATVRLHFPRRLPSHVRAALESEMSTSTGEWAVFEPQSSKTNRTNAAVADYSKIQNVSDTTSGSMQLSLCDRVRARAALQRMLEGLVNVTVSVFALGQGSRPAHRLSVPLQLLTHRRGADYINSRVISTQSGHVKRSTERVKPSEIAPDGVAKILRLTHAHATVRVPKPGGQKDTKNSTHTNTLSSFANEHNKEEAATVVQCDNGATDEDAQSELKLNSASVDWNSSAHYPDTTPVPLITALARFMQAHVFPSLSVTASLLLTIRYSALLALLAVLLVILGCCVVAYLNSWRWCQRVSMCCSRGTRVGNNSHSYCVIVADRTDLKSSTRSVSKHHYE